MSAFVFFTAIFLSRVIYSHFYLIFVFDTISFVLVLLYLVTDWSSLLQFVLFLWFRLFIYVYCYRFDFCDDLEIFLILILNLFEYSYFNFTIFLRSYCLRFMFYIYIEEICWVVTFLRTSKKRGNLLNQFLPKASVLC